jgi:hypothetical protein
METSAFDHGADSDEALAGPRGDLAGKGGVDFADRQGFQVNRRHLRQCLTMQRRNADIIYKGILKTPLNVRRMIARVNIIITAFSVEWPWVRP